MLIVVVDRHYYCYYIRLMSFFPGQPR